MAYDKANWHSSGEFPADSPEAYGGTHIGLYLRDCFIQGWAGEIHTDEEPDAVASVVQGEMSGTEFLYKYCDGKFTDEDLNDEGNAFTAEYYGENGRFLGDYQREFADHVYLSPESAHDFVRFTRMIDERRASGDLTE